MRKEKKNMLQIKSIPNRSGKLSSIKVKVYSSHGCPYCQMAKVWLLEHRISFAEFDVLKDETAKAYIIKKTGKSCVPQIEVGDEVIIGFDREALERAIVKLKKRSSFSKIS